MDCGPACLCVISKHYDKCYSIGAMRKISYMNHSGVPLPGISRAAEKIGFHAVVGRLTFDKLVGKALLPL
jgi:ATP-binding cassette subfamily B protein